MTTYRWVSAKSCTMGASAIGMSVVRVTLPEASTTMCWWCSQPKK